MSVERDGQRGKDNEVNIIVIKPIWKDWCRGWWPRLIKWGNQRSACWMFLLGTVCNCAWGHFIYNLQLSSLRLNLLRYTNPPCYTRATSLFKRLFSTVILIPNSCSQRAGAATRLQTGRRSERLWANDCKDKHALHGRSFLFTDTRWWGNLMMCYGRLCGLRAEVTTRCHLPPSTGD